MRYVNVVRWSRGYCTTEKWEVDNFKVEIITFVVDYSLKSSVRVDIEEKIRIGSTPYSFDSILNLQIDWDMWDASTH